MKRPGIVEALGERKLEVLGELLGLDGPVRPGATVKCPNGDGHENGDKRPSFVVGRNGAGGQCMACGLGGGLLGLVRQLHGLPDLAAAAAWLEERYLPRRDRPVPRNRQHVYQIRDAGGGLVAEHVRTDGPDGKGFLWRRNGRSGLAGLRAADLPHYGTELLAKATADARVLLVEGEKAADALRGLGLLALGTVTGAAGTPSRDVLEPLRGREVYLWPDNDAPGRQHMARIAALLDALGAHPYLVEWRDAPDRGDAANLVAAGGGREEVLELLKAAKPWSPAKAEPEPGRIASYVEPLDTLPQEPAAEAVLGALEAVREQLEGADALLRATVREEAVRLLKKRSLSAPAKMVDAALEPLRAKATAEPTQGKRLTLRDPEPSTEPVDGRALLDDLEAFFALYLVLPAHGAAVLALWSTHTHAVDAFDVTPYLTCSSPTHRCGKSRVLELLALVVPRSVSATSLTPATLFRTVEAHAPTLLIDEADTALKNNDDLRTVINAGYSRATSCVPRCAGDEHEPRLFDAFGAKAVALIGKPPATILDRSIELRMRRKAKTEKVARFRRREVVPVAHELARRAARWAADHVEALRDVRPEIPDALDDRAADICEPLLAVADLAGGGWPARAREAVLALCGPAARGMDEGDLGLLLLADVRDLFGATTADRLASADIVKRLHDLEERPWAELRGKGLTTHRLARLLGRFDISARALAWGGTRNDGTRGYKQEQFEDVWERFLPSESASPQDPRLASGFSAKSKCKPPAPDLHFQNGQIPLRERALADLHFETGNEGRVYVEEDIA